MPATVIDTLVMIIADQNGGKSNQIRSIFEESELKAFYGGYPAPDKIKCKYLVHPDIELFLRLSSWHEREESYAVVKKDIRSASSDSRLRYKVLVPAQVTATEKLVGGEDLFMKLCGDFDVRRGFAVWLNPDRSDRRSFALSPEMAAFLSDKRHLSALSIDSLAAHPSAAPTLNSINSRLLADLLFRA